MRYDYKEFLKALGQRVKKLRKERGLTHRALMTAHGFHLTQLQRIERGEGVSVPMLLRLAETFGMPVEKLIAGLGLIADGEIHPKKTRE
jgi:transcriptional regulator with XRE-family HTH domain